jgi:predicted DsbA family dithiol-disulfide isomerase
MTQIDIVSDFVCPWCFIGLRRLEIALAEVRREIPDFACEKRWRPFFLNPDTPPEGEPYLPFLEKKFGGRAPVEALFERVRQAGRAYGIDYAFEKISLRANTLLAHRLVHWSQQRGEAVALVERLFVSQFQRGEYVGDPAVLLAIAVECGYPADEVKSYLASDQDIEVVKGLAAQIRARGISMVPTFILNGTHVVVGAEDPSILAQALRRTLA